jgi:alkyl hydroperoxide reductase subunit AhpC
VPLQIDAEKNMEKKIQRGSATVRSFDSGSRRTYPKQHVFPFRRLCHGLLSTGAGVWVGNQRDSSQPTRRSGWVSCSSAFTGQAEFPNLERIEFTKEMTMTTATETYSVPRINDTAPDFTADTTQGTIHFHDWIGDGWAVLFSHPKDFTPVCTTELGYMAKLQPEFAKRNVKIIGLSVDPVSSHGKWAADIEETQGAKVNYPMIGDPRLEIAKLYGMLPASAGETSEGRTPVDNATVRTVFVVGPDKKVKLQISYPMTTGRNFDEILRVIDSMQLTAKHKVATPVNWKQGEDVIITGAVSNEEAAQKFPGFKTIKPYLRVTAQPK